ncbi:MAG: beta-galactosidase trimerization domain-containing protein, partial [Clostridia bacterium]|nr:beta-galactosidase trimerization domain-containing protein [Clostridia bacterium]
ASMSVGDHLHPLGKIDKSTYNIIGHAFEYADKIEKYSKNTKAYSDIAMWSSHNSDADMGCSKMLQIMHLEYDVLESGDDISKYNCIVLPDCVKLSNQDKSNLVEFANNGGKLIVSGNSVFDELGIKSLGSNGFDLDYIECEIDEICTPFLAYSNANKVECDGEVLASLHEPYFNRRVTHFCGHANTPFKMEKASYPALVKKDNILYFAHPVFSAYNKSGNYILQKYIMKGFNNIYNKSLKIEGLPSCGRVRMRKSELEHFYALHLLYAPPVNRGNVCLLEDFPELNNIQVTFKISEKVKAVISQPDGIEIPFVQAENELKFTVDKFSLHKLIEIKYE